MKEKTPLVFKIEPALHERLTECSKRLGVKKYSLGILALEAAVNAIERNGYKLVVPIEFDVRHVPVEKTGIPNHFIFTARRIHYRARSVRAEEKESRIIYLSGIP